MYVNSTKEINEAPFVAQVEYFDPLRNKQLAIKSKIKFIGWISRRRWAQRLNGFAQGLLRATREA